MKNKNMYLILAAFCSVQVVGQRSVDLMRPVSMEVGDPMVDIGLDDKVRKYVADRLNKLLSDEYVLYVKTQKFHWNIVGPFFGSLHKLFNKQYDQLAEIIDEVAERVRALGHKAFGTLAEFVQYSSIKEEPGNNPDANGMIKELLSDHELIIREIRDYINYTASHEDLGTENFLADLIVTHQKMAWMLRAHLLEE